MVAVAQSVEFPDVAREVVGSNPIGYPMKLQFKFRLSPISLAKVCKNHKDLLDRKFLWNGKICVLVDYLEAATNLHAYQSIDEPVAIVVEELDTYEEDEYVTPEKIKFVCTFSEFVHDYKFLKYRKG